MRVKSSQIAPGLANARPPGSAKFGKCPPPPQTKKAGKWPAVARGLEGGGEGSWAQLELTDA